MSFCVCCVANGEFSPDKLTQRDKDRLCVFSSVCSCAHTVCDKPSKLPFGEQLDSFESLMHLLSFMLFFKSLQVLFLIICSVPSYMYLKG